jgi:hypothetical protein
VKQKLLHPTAAIAASVVMTLVYYQQLRQERKADTYLAKLEAANGAMLGIDQ